LTIWHTFTCTLADSASLEMIPSHFSHYC